MLRHLLRRSELKRGRASNSSLVAVDQASRYALREEEC